MTQKQISIGAAPDDGTGDPLRTAFTKINQNASEAEARFTGLEAGGGEFTTEADMVASDAPSRGIGAAWRAAGFRFKEVSSSEEVTTASGAKLHKDFSGPFTRAHHIGEQPRSSIKGLERTETVSELTSPKLPSNAGRQVILAGQPPALAYCDGTSWWDMTSGAKISPWWLPRGAKVHVDFDKGHFYWKGGVRSLSDLKAVPAGGYTLEDGFGFTDVAWVNLEWSHDNETADGTGQLFAWTSGYPFGNRVEVVLSNDPTWGNYPNLYCSPGDPVADFSPLASKSKIGEGGAFSRFTERQSLLFRVKSGQTHLGQNQNGELSLGTKKAGTMSTPTEIGFACRPWSSGDPDAQLTNGTLHRVTIWSDDLAVEHTNALGRRGDAAPVHLLGDSFLNLYAVFNRLGEQFDAAGVRVALSQDGVGGSTLTDQAARYKSADPKWRDSTLVICDFGMETDSAESFTAIRDMLETINHDRWLYMQPAPSGSAAISPGGLYYEKQARMQEFCGVHYVSTLPEAWAESDGSAEDEDLVSRGLWPLSLRMSMTDFHPSAKGQAFIARRIYEALSSRGWA